MLKIAVGLRDHVKALLIANETSWERGYGETKHEGAAWPLLDIASYARRGPVDRVHLAQEEIQLLSRTVRRTPEVLVTKGGRDLKAIGRHLIYLNRDGDSEIETDDGRRLKGEGVEQELLEAMYPSLDHPCLAEAFMPSPWSQRQLLPRRVGCSPAAHRAP
jgi:hypothetical protein